MKAAELRQQSVTELKKELSALLREQFNLRMQRGIGQLKQPHRFKAVRHDIARVQTLLVEKAES